jgi:hypothetical protein
MPTFTFTLRETTAHEISRRTGAFHATSGTMAGAIIDHLGSGRDVVGTMAHVGVGIRFPSYVTVDFHEECPETGALRAQAEARTWQGASSMSRQIPPAGDDPEDPFDAPAHAGALFYVEGARRATAVADALGAIAVVHPTDARTGERALHEGGVVVATLEAMNGDFRMPSGTALAFDPAIPKTMARGRAETRGLILGAVEPSLDERSRFFTALSRPLPNPFPSARKEPVPVDPDPAFDPDDFAF